MADDYNISFSDLVKLDVSDGFFSDITGGENFTPLDIPFEGESEF